MSKEDYGVQITSNRKLVEDAAEEAILRALEAIGLQAEGYAKKELSKPWKHADGKTHPTVDTGLLRNSITHAVSGENIDYQYQADKGNGSGKVSGTVGKEGDNAVYIGTNVEYAPYIEYGTSKMEPHPFIQPAVTKHAEEYKRIAEHYLKGEDQITD